MVIDKFSAAKYSWGDGCEAFVLADAGALSVKQESMPPGAKEQLHVHNTAQQFFYVLNGEASFCIDGNHFIVGEGQGIHIRPGQQHFVENLSDSALEILVISQPVTDTDRINIDNPISQSNLS